MKVRLEIISKYIANSLKIKGFTIFMNHLHKAYTLFNSLKFYKSEMEAAGLNHEYYEYGESYYQEMNQSAIRLLEASIKLVDDEDGFLERLIGDYSGHHLSNFQVDIIIHHLDGFLKLNNWLYFDNLLKNASHFREKYQYNIAAYNIRLFAENCLKIRLKDFSKVKDMTIGQMRKHIHDIEIIDDVQYSKHKPNVDKLNRLVHHKIEQEYNEEIDNEVLNLEGWARRYEKDVISKDLVKSEY